MVLEKSFFLLLDNHKQKTAYGGHIHFVHVKPFQRRRCFRNWRTRNKNCLWSCLFTERNEISNLYRIYSIDSSCQVSVHLAKRFQKRRIVRNPSSRNKNCLWRYCLFTYRNETNIFNRGPSIDDANQISFHLAKRLQRRRLKLCKNMTVWLNRSAETILSDGFS